jgi:phosphoglycerate dehydrogenase-like enzyme
MSERELSLMKPTAVLINTSRGPVVDEKALYKALKEKRIAAAGLDVLEQEPTPPDNPLLLLDNCVITPHLAGASREARIKSMDFAIENVKRLARGKEPQSIVSPS